jgi:uncharacterized RDD family membrane protein YckC
MNQNPEILTAELSLDNTRYPNLLKRIQSIFIDTLLIVLAMFLVARLLDRSEDVPDWVRAAIFVGLYGVYEPVCTSFGTTAGNYLMNIRVRRHEHEIKKINILQAYIRFFLKVFLGWLSFITLHMTKQKRAIHDLAAGSVMIELSNKRNNK